MGRGPSQFVDSRLTDNSEGVEVLLRQIFPRLHKFVYGHRGRMSLSARELRYSLGAHGSRNAHCDHDGRRSQRKDDLPHDNLPTVPAPHLSPVGHAWFKVAAEMALSVLAYNLTRVMNIVGIKPLIAAIAA